MKFTKGILLSCLTAAVLACSANAAGFEKINEYPDGKFTDVKTTDWFASDVQSTYELGLMNGTGDNVFAPKGNVTVAEAITMSVRANCINSGKEAIKAGTGAEWYKPYVDYAIANGIIKADTFDSYTRQAKRYEVAQLFAAAMPDGYYTAKNDVTEIPDVASAQKYYADVLELYKAGVIMGSDSYGNFRPEDNITRAESAAIINRVAIPENRLQKKLDKVSKDDAYILAFNQGMSSSKEGLSSGWILDNRGATPRTDIVSSQGTLFDISETEGSAYIREFNKTSTGTFVLETALAISGYDGVYAEFVNDKGDSVYRLETVNGNWAVLGPDGKYTTVYEISKNDNLNFELIIKLDLDNARATTIINQKDCGTLPTAKSGDEANILSYRYGTTEKSTSLVSSANLSVVANYSVYDLFTTTSNEYKNGWSFNGAKVSGETLKLPNAGTSAYIGFSPVSTKPVVEFHAILPKKEDTTAYIQSGAKNILTLSTKDGNFTVNGKKVYENYYANLWYRFRFEIDPVAMTADVKVNNRLVGTVDLAEKATSIDGLTIINNAASQVTFDDVKVFKLEEHEDYVPVPVVPEGTDDYIVGMNVCPLWSNGTHWGWACVSPYADIKPVLGYYDEGVAETADWEIKYLVEHGIDFQAFCVYFNEYSDVQRLTSHDANHLYNGFMNAKYSDMSKFCIIWETANAGSPKSMDQWKNHYVPYFVENFFKDPRYMTIENKLVVSVFGASKLSSRIGGDAKVKEMFDYLDEYVKTLGFDGVIYLSCGSSTKQLKDMGFDGCHAYNWGTDGYKLETNTKSIQKSAADGNIYTVPTISVGFNNVGWAGERHPLMSVEDYKKAHEWVKNNYLPSAAKEDWQKNFVMLSTWNEYGEGTYIMPSEDLNGFGYIDTIREAYTGEKANESLNNIPTDNQLYRITHRYPQYRHLLRKQDIYEEDLTKVDYEVVFAHDYSTNPTPEIASYKDLVVDENGINATAMGDVLINIKAKETVNLDTIDAIRITYKAPAGKTAQIFYTSTTATLSEANSVKCTSTSDELTSYVISVEDKASFSGDLVTLRVDPVQGENIPFVLKSIELLRNTSKSSKKMSINKQEFDLSFAAKKNSAGKTVVAFDPALAMDFRLNIFYDWKPETKTLVLNFTDNVVTYTVGSNKYTVDGKEMDLGFTLEDIDGLPMLPLEDLCKIVGYTYEVNEDGVICITTDQLDYFEYDENTADGDWQFDRVNNAQGWTSTFFSILVHDGYMQCVPNSNSTDPTMVYPPIKDNPFPAEKYTHLEIKLRYKYDSEGSHAMTFYFDTDLNPGLNEQKTLRAQLASTDSQGEWETYTIDLSKQPLWKDNITTLRFDPFNAVGTVDIDYIKFTENKDYVPAAERPFELLNGGFENDSLDTFSGEGKVVAHPDEANNKCVLVSGQPGKEQWLYWIYKPSITYKPGVTYRFECDVKLASYGGEMEVPDEISTEVLFNAQYFDPDKASVDHVVQPTESAKISKADGWKHYVYEFTIPETSKVRYNDKISLYTNPQNKLSVGYYLDNVKISIVEAEAKEETAPEAAK